MATSLKDIKPDALIVRDATQNMLHNIDLFEVEGDYVFVANGFGNLSIYKVPNLKEKIGTVSHYSKVLTILCFDNMTNTGIKTKNLFLLEKRGKQDGSLSMYIIKE